MKRQSPRLAAILCIVLVVAGIAFRFTNLGRKIYGLDETFTSLRISGYTEAQAVEELRAREVVETADLQKFQRSNADTPFSGTVLGLMREEPQHPPLYYVLARLWARGVGDSVVVTRTLPALLSLLALPAMFWLCRELFEDPLVAWVATALLAVSPFHLLYAQEARQYSLWTATTLASSAALLRAMRRDTARGWSLYAILLAASFYTFLLAALVALGHAIYVIIVQRFRLDRTVVRYVAASLVAGVLFLPWAAGVLANFSQVRSTTTWNEGKRAGVAALARNWARQPGRAFFDLNPSADAPRGYRLLQWGFTAVGLAGIAVALVVLCRHAPRKAWAFVVTLIGVTGAGLVLQDLIVGGQGGAASTYSRYLTPCYLGFAIAVAYLLVRQTGRASASPAARMLWRGMAGLFFAGGVASCLLVLGARIWWNKGGPEYLADIRSAAAVINACEQPLLLSDGNTWSMLFVSHLLDAKVKLVVRPRCFSCKLPAPADFAPDFARHAATFSDVFLFPGPSRQLMARAQEQGFRLRPYTFTLRETFLRKLEAPAPPATRPALSAAAPGAAAPSVAAP
ncbi:MAG TPA: glycosyltransferase family 39 protein [Tepidisphaeraceae bacterium]|nr:glycosyltransferase family 39 protein [Tepidisphaeraceae bacterium]